MDGFKHEDDWLKHPYGCECDKCYEKVMKNAEELVRELKAIKWEPSK